jgi:transposase-like protein
LRSGGFLAHRSDEGNEDEPEIERVERRHRGNRARHPAADAQQYSAEEKIRIVVAGLRGEDSIAELCRRQGIAEGLYYSWSKEFLEAGKKRLAGDTARQASAGEVKICAARCATSRRRLPKRFWRTGC